MDLNFAQDGCCGGYLHAEVKHDNGLRSLVEDKGDGIYTVLTMKGWMPHVQLIEGMSRTDVDAELERVAKLML